MFQAIKMKQQACELAPPDQAVASPVEYMTSDTDSEHLYPLLPAPVHPGPPVSQHPGPVSQHPHASVTYPGYLQQPQPVTLNRLGEALPPVHQGYVPVQLGVPAAAAAPEYGAVASLAPYYAQQPPHYAQQPSYNPYYAQ